MISFNTNKEPFIIKPEYCYRAMSTVTGVAHVGGRSGFLQLMDAEQYSWCKQSESISFSALRRILMLRHNVK